MNTIRKVLAGTVLAGGALLTARRAFRIASAADDADRDGAAPGGPREWKHHHGSRSSAAVKLGLTDGTEGAGQGHHARRPSRR